MRCNPKHILTNGCSQVLGIAEGLAYLHDNNVIHGDMKAVSKCYLILTYLNRFVQDNVLMSNEGQPLICDFGLARVVPESVSLSNSTNNMRGSIRWMAAEFFSYDDMKRVSRHSKTTDIWSFGATVYVSLPF